MSKKVPTAADAYKAALDKKYGYSVGIDRAEKPDEFTIHHLGIPAMSNLDVERDINIIMSDHSYMKEINELIIKDKNERYVRELLNRLNKIVKYMEKFVSDSETGGINPNIVIDIAKGNNLDYWKTWLDKETFEMIKSKGDKHE